MGAHTTPDLIRIFVREWNAGFSQAAIAARTGKSEKTVQRQLARIAAEDPQKLTRPLKGWKD